jgi:hypothetical protein
MRRVLKKEHTMNSQKMQKLSIAMAAALAFLAIGAVENAKAGPLPDGSGGGYGSYDHRYYSHYGYHYRTPP